MRREALADRGTAIPLQQHYRRLASACREQRLLGSRQLADSTAHARLPQTYEVLRIMRRNTRLLLAILALGLVSLFGMFVVTWSASL